MSCSTQDRFVLRTLLQISDITLGIPAFSRPRYDDWFSLKMLIVHLLPETDSRVTVLPA
jgi:hypothetical protein